MAGGLQRCVLSRTHAPVRTRRPLVGVVKRITPRSGKSCLLLTLKMLNHLSCLWLYGTRLLPAGT